MYRGCCKPRVEGDSGLSARFEAIESGRVAIDHFRRGSARTGLDAGRRGQRRGEPQWRLECPLRRATLLARAGVAEYGRVLHSGGFSNKDCCHSGQLAGCERERSQERHGFLLSRTTETETNLGAGRPPESHNCLGNVDRQRTGQRDSAADRLQTPAAAEIRLGFALGLATVEARSLPPAGPKRRAASRFAR